MPYRLLLSLVFISSLIIVHSQQVIVIDNPSFEEAPRMGTNNNYSINGWYDCGALYFKGESPPDIHPGNFWDVRLSPSHGDTYLGLVVRDNDTWEGLSQRLTSPIEAGKYYSFSVDLAKSPTYNSHSRMNTFYNEATGRKEPIPMNFTTPSILRVWGGNGYCEPDQLLFVSSTINNEYWEEHVVYIAPKADYSFITFEVYYTQPVELPYCGHILLDNISDLELISKEQYELNVKNPVINNLEAPVSSYKEKQKVEETRVISNYKLSEAIHVYDFLQTRGRFKSNCDNCESSLKAYAFVILESKAKDYGLYRSINSLDDHYYEALKTAIIDIKGYDDLTYEIKDIITFIEEKNKNGNPPNYLQKIDLFSNSKIGNLLNKAFIMSYIESDMDQLILELNEIINK